MPGGRRDGEMGNREAQVQLHWFVVAQSNAESVKVREADAEWIVTLTLARFSRSMIVNEEEACETSSDQPLPAGIQVVMLSREG